TGTPGGIWTIESRASSPSSTDFDDRSGTPITGSSVWAATTPGSAAARPAPQISTSRPRPAAPFAYSATASGARCAERTSNSQPIPRASSSSIAACIRSRSDSEPTRIPTRSSGTGGGLRDVAPVAGSVEGDQLDRVVGAAAGGGEVGAGGGHREDPAAVRHQRAAANRRAGVEDERAGRLGGGDPVDPGARVDAVR